MFADLDLGLVDGAVMAMAEERRLPILTFDFRHFRAAHPSKGYWDLLVTESDYQRAIRR
jgi:predicted nucleic acid-binding protein